MNQLPQAAAAPGGGGAEDASLDALRDCAEFMMAFGKVIPCGKAFPHDWSACPFAHPTEAARRRDPRVHPHTGVSCPRLKKEGRCELGDACPYAHSIFEYWLHPSRYRTQLCKDGGACKRWLCFFAHSLEELRLPDNKPCVPSEATMAALAATLAANTGLATEPPLVGAPPGWASGAAAAPQRALLDPPPGAAQTPAQPRGQHAQGDAEVAQLVLRLLERGELGPEKAAALLRQLLPPDALGQPQAAPPPPPPATCGWEACSRSESHAPAAHQLAPSLPMRGSADGLAAYGWAPSQQLPMGAQAHMLMAQQGALLPPALPGGQQGTLQGALGPGPSQLHGTAASRLMGMSGGAMLAPAAEAALFVHSGRSSFGTARSSSDAHAAGASSSAGTSPGRGSPPVLGSASSDASAATSLAAAVLGLHLPAAVPARH